MGSYTEDTEDPGGEPSPGRACLRGRAVSEGRKAGKQDCQEPCLSGKGSPGPWGCSASPQPPAAAGSHCSLRTLLEPTSTGRAFLSPVAKRPAQL